MYLRTDLDTYQWGCMQVYCHTNIEIEEIYSIHCSGCRGLHCSVCCRFRLPNPCTPTPHPGYWTRLHGQPQINLENLYSRKRKRPLKALKLCRSPTVLGINSPPTDITASSSTFNLKWVKEVLCPTFVASPTPASATPRRAIGTVSLISLGLSWPQNSCKVCVWHSLTLRKYSLTCDEIPELWRRAQTS